MRTQTINAELFRRMLFGAAAALQAKRNEINRLNVFPVPDGDTGSNMFLTLDAVRNSPIQGNDISSYAESAAKAIMRSARGNSGVILSLFFRGMAAAFAGHDTADITLLIQAFRQGSDSARKAVMKPVEGTILTVMKECTDSETVMDSEDIGNALESILVLAKESLKRTPELLPALKKAKVVDSGGYGFCIVISGMLKALSDDYEDLPIEGPASDADFSAFSAEEITFSFCTECLINRSADVSEDQVDALRPFLTELGDSVVLVADDEIIKVHVHTNEPMTVLGRMLEFGTPQFIKVENMLQQHSALVTDSEQKESAEENLSDSCRIITVANGDGIHDLFMELGADYVIPGGQSMNPSANDFLKAIRELKCSRAIILPNNSNIILTANQASAMAEGVQVEVVKTVTIPQGISALISFDEACGMRENIENMTVAKDSVKTLSVTRAVKNADIDGIKVSKKQFIGLSDNDLKCAADTLDECLVKLAEEIGDREIITVYCGKGVKEQDAEKTVALLRSRLEPYQQVSVVYGRQPVYSYIISAE